MRMHPRKLLVLMFVLFSTVSGQQGHTKTLTVGHFKHEPVEVVSTKLCGATVTPRTAFTIGDDWTKDLEITIKNVSEQPVSYVNVLLYTPADEGSNQMISNSDYGLAAGLILTDRFRYCSRTKPQSSCTGLPRAIRATRGQRRFCFNKCFEPTTSG